VERVSTGAIAGFATVAVITADAARATNRPPPAHGVPLGRIGARAIGDMLDVKFQTPVETIFDKVSVASLLHGHHILVQV
jgi:hypothetical protein